ncbi:hypothetical protein [Rubritalea tangerina]|uniref:hypothetical protein n=1 Tax=Rubritalea tangerina TaxID=430798 RepID=UPI0036147CA5
MLPAGREGVSCPSNFKDKRQINVSRWPRRCGEIASPPVLARVIWSQLPCGKEIWEAEASFVSGFVVFHGEDVYPRHEIRLARCKIYSQRAANHFVHTA